MSEYLITGITGFVGPHLASLLLDEGHKVSGLIRGSNGREQDLLDVLSEEEIKTINWEYGDLRDYPNLFKVFNNSSYDGVFHLAAQSHPPTSLKYPINTFKNNVMGTVNIVEAIRKTQSDCSFMFCSTSEVYGDMAKEVGTLKEDLPLSPSNPYGASKAAMDLYIQERCKNDFLNGFITRAFSHTGPRRGKNFSISVDAYNLARIKKGIKKSHTLPVGNLETKRVVIDVRDMVNAYYLLMNNFENGEAYNICGPKEDVRKMKYFTDKLIDISGLDNITKEIKDEYYREVDIEIQIGSTFKLKKRVDWEPKIPIDKTLQDLFDYWMQKL